MNDSIALHPRSLRYVERASGHDVIQKILVVVDPTSVWHPCIEKAARLAASFGSTVELYVCDVAPNVPPSWAGGSTVAQYRGVMRERRLAMLEDLAAPLRRQGIQVVTETEWRAPLEEGVVVHAIRTQADLVVKDTHRHSIGPLTTALHTDWLLIRQLPMPLLLVRPKPWPEHPLVAASVDPCHAAERPVELDESLLRVTRSISRAIAGDVSVLHALQSPPHLPEQPLCATTVQGAYDRQREAVEQLVCRADLAPRSVKCVEGRVPEAIVEFAETEAPAVLVMGVAARQRLQGSATSTAAEVLEQTECDLLVLKPNGFVSPVLVADR